MIKIYKSDIKHYMYEKIERARQLYNILFLTQYNINKEEDAEKYLKLKREYNMIAEMLRDLRIYNWLDNKDKFLELDDIELFG